MTTHPRHEETTRAGLDIQTAVMAASSQYRLTFAELVNILAVVLTSWSKSVVIADRKAVEDKCVDVRAADEALKYSDEAMALRTAGLGPFCARFKTFQFISDFVEKFQSGNPMQQLDLMHEYSDLIPKEIIGAGIYEYTPRVGAGVKE